MKYTMSDDGAAGIRLKVCGLHADRQAKVDRMKAELMGPAPAPLPAWACRGPLGWLRTIVQRWLDGRTPDQVAKHRALRAAAGFTTDDAGALR